MKTTQMHQTPIKQKKIGFDEQNYFDEKFVQE